MRIPPSRRQASEQHSLTEEQRSLTTHLLKQPCGSHHMTVLFLPTLVKPPVPCKKISKKSSAPCAVITCN